MSPFLARGVSRTVRAISSVLPCHTKRLVLWSVLYSKMHGRRDMTKEQCDRLNEVLELCKDNAALALPAQLGVYIWKDLDECTAATTRAVRGEESIDAAAKDFISSIPDWLRYASDAFMVKDFQKLLTFYLENRHNRQSVHQ